jgi:flagellum-specific ATP synthase
MRAEIVGFRNGVCQAAPFGSLAGLGPGTRARARTTLAPRPGAGGTETGGSALAVSDRWLGRVIDPLGQPLDRRGPLPAGALARPVRGSPPDAATRARLGPPLDLGVRAMNLFTTCREGQRLGLFAGSGVGKSTLLAMLARHARCDVVVLALVGERGREVRDFIEDELGADGLARSVVVVATSDTPALMRREAAYAALTIAEHFRDGGRSVLLLMDSVTRFCLAAREIGLSAGEPPATRGYPPSVFAELPRLLERAGPGPERASGPSGHITAFFTVLVEGDDHDEPITDTVRGILDGHVVLTRAIAEGGRYPAVDVLRSLSRTVPGCLTGDQPAMTRRARALLATQAEMADMVRLGAYRKGSDPAVDEAIARAPRIEDVLRQERDEKAGLAESFAALGAALDAA